VDETFDFIIVGSGGGRPQALIQIREPGVFFRLEVGFVPPHLPRLLLAGQIRGECRELLMAGLPQCA